MASKRRRVPGEQLVLSDRRLEMPALSPEKKSAAATAGKTDAAAR